MTDVFVEIRERRGVVDPVKGTISRLSRSQRQRSFEEAKILLPRMLLLFITNGNRRSERVRFTDTFQVLKFGFKIVQFNMTVMLFIQRILHGREHIRSTSFESGIEAAAMILTHSC